MTDGLKIIPGEKFPKPNGHANDDLILKCIADIEPQPVQWIWNNRLARGKLTLFAGEPGIGKSQGVLNVAAIISTAGTWPDGGDATCGSIVILSAEDSAADTVRPRLEAAGADLTRIHVVEAAIEKGKRRTFSLQSDLARLGEKIAAIGDVRLVIIDPITSYMGKIDSHRTTDVRGALEPLADFAAQYNVAVLAVSHPPKNAPANALHAITGSLAFVAAARLVFIAIEEPDGDGRFLLLSVKNNLGPPAAGLGYHRLQRIVSKGIVASYIAWDSQPVTMTANEALAATADHAKNGSAISKAADLLRNLLADGPMLATEVSERAEAADISARTLKRARHKLNVESVKDGFQGKWAWRLPGITEGSKQARAMREVDREFELAVTEAPKAKGGQEAFSAHDDRTFHPRPKTIDGYEVIGPEPDGTPCAQCGQSNGTVYLIRNPNGGIQSEALHEECARARFAPGTSNVTEPSKGGQRGPPKEAKGAKLF